MSALSARAQRSSSRQQNVYEPQRNARDHSELAPPELIPRKWHKTLKSVGHLRISTWTPLNQQNPTEELQKGHFKTNRKERQYNEAARMTRSIRQQFDAPLEPPVDNIQLLKPPRHSTHELAIRNPSHKIDEDIMAKGNQQNLLINQVKISEIVDEINQASSEEKEISGEIVMV